VFKISNVYVSADNDNTNNHSLGTRESQSHHQLMQSWAKIAFFGLIISNPCKKMGINYPDLEPGDEFWNQIRVQSSCYKSFSRSEQQ